MTPRKSLSLIALLLVAALSISSVRCFTEEVAKNDVSEAEDLEEDVANEDYPDESDLGKDKIQEVPIVPPEAVHAAAGQQGASYNAPPAAYEKPAAQPYTAPPAVAPYPDQQYPSPPKQPYQAPPQEYQPPQQQSYQQPQQPYQQPQQSYQQPQQSYQQPQQSYQQPQQSYQQPQQQYQQPQQQYQQPQQQYQQPQQGYGVSQSSIDPYQVTPEQPIYPSLIQFYQTTGNWNQPQPIQPSYQGVQQVSNYSQPAYKQQQPQPQPQQSHQLPVQPAYSQKPVIGINPVPNYPSNIKIGNKYSIPDLGPVVFPIGNRPSYPQSAPYFRNNHLRICPKFPQRYGPTPADIQAAFVFAQQQMEASRNVNIQFLDSSSQSWAARHHMFSYLNQSPARMDEEGLLLELVSLYLSDRSCLSRWDRQRYLPTYTKLLGARNFPTGHSCAVAYNNPKKHDPNYCMQSRYRTIDGYCNNPWNPYWGKSNVCHIRFLAPDYADGIAEPRVSYNPRVPLPNPRLISNMIHHEVPLDSPYNMLKMQWGQFINHDITNTALSSYDGLVDCCKNPNVRGCWPIWIPPNDYFYGPLNITCLSFIRSAVCPTCQLGPRQQVNKNSAFLDASQVYGNTQEQSQPLRVFRGGLLKHTLDKFGFALLPINPTQSKDQCSGGPCFLAGDNRANQHPALTSLHTLMHRNHNQHALALARRHPEWNDEIIFQEARRLTIAEYQMITYKEYLPIVFGPTLSAYYRLLPSKGGYTKYDPKIDPTSWNEYVTASCRFGHSQIRSLFGLYNSITGPAGYESSQPTFRLKEWFQRPSFLQDGLIPQILNGLMTRVSYAVDPWVTTDVRNHLYQNYKDRAGGDLPATNIWRGRDHGIAPYIAYVDYCFNIKVRTWKDLASFIPRYTLEQLRKTYRVVENIDLFVGGLSERHFQGADIGPTFACLNGIQYHHLKFGDRFYFEHGGQAGSFTPAQLDEIRRTSLARLICRTGNVKFVPQNAFLKPSPINPIIPCDKFPPLDYRKF